MHLALWRSLWIVNGGLYVQITGDPMRAVWHVDNLTTAPSKVRKSIDLSDVLNTILI